VVGRGFRETFNLYYNYGRNPGEERNGHTQKWDINAADAWIKQVQPNTSAVERTYRKSNVLLTTTTAAALLLVIHMGVVAGLECWLFLLESIRR
jgi:hypothetical protein